MSTFSDVSGTGEDKGKERTPKGWTSLRVHALGIRLRAV